MMKTVLYSCPFVPAEWIEAHGLVAQRITPRAGVRSARSFPEPGVCPYAASFAERVAQAGDHVAAIFSTKCDQMRRLFDLAAAQCSKPVFLFNVPTVVDSSSAEPMYVAELHRLGRFLEQVGGTLPNGNWWKAHTRLRPEYDERGSKGLARLAVTGGPLPKNAGFFDQVRQAGGVVVVDASENSDDICPEPVNPERCREDALRELARVYLSIRSIHQRPNTGFYERLRERVAKHGVSGLILRRYVWCDLWQGEAHRLMQVLGLPVLDLQVESDTPADMARGDTRVQAFIEMLQNSAMNPSHV